jgi:hypothetical protein
MALLYREGRTVPEATAYHVAQAADVDELLDGVHPAWIDARAIAWGPPSYRTRFRALWSRAGLAICFDCADVAPWATCRIRDERLWEEEVVELFLDPAETGTDYAEIEISPINVVCDLRVRAPWPRLAAEIDWDLEGLRSAVEPWRDNEAGPRGWTATAVLPWRGLAPLSPAAAARLPPRRGDRWRFNVFRIKRPHGPDDRERDAIYAAWSVPDAPSFHVPAAFRPLVFQ